MRQSLFLAVVLLAANECEADEVQPPRDPSKFHVFLLAGQSNMAGRGEVEPQDQTPHPRVVAFDKLQRWVPAIDPLHFDKPRIVGVGLGRSFAAEYAKAHPDVTVGLIPCAVGGSGISTWQPGGFHKQTKLHPYDDAIKRATAALRHGTLKGILWHQGESDSNEKSAPDYQQKLDQLIDRFREVLNAESVPFIVGQLGRFEGRPWNEFREQVDRVHRTLPARVSKTAFVRSDGLTDKGDLSHFDSRSYREFGRRYFAAYQSLKKPTRPNVLFIFADDVGREVLECYGGESYRTPNIDQLAKTGQKYTHCYSMPVCHPSRICLLTGRYPAVLENPRWGSFPRHEEPNTLASILKRAGYATAVAGKWQLGLMKKDLMQPLRMGFDQWSVFGWHEGPRYHEPMIYENGKLRDDTEGMYGPDLYVDFLIDFMKKPRNRPFFAWYSMALCHDVTDDIGEPVPYGPNDRWLNYAEMAADMDHQAGRLIQFLKENKLRNNTLVIFTTDNGTAGASYLRYTDGRFERPSVYSRIGGRSVQGGKGKLNDWGTRVPLIVSQPGKVKQGEVVSDLVDFSDFLPTLAEITGATIPDAINLNGHSFAKRILGTGTTQRRWAYSELRNGRQFVRTREFKLYRNGRFFHMATDPEEKQSLGAGSLNAAAAKVHSDLTSALRLLPPVQAR